MLASGEARRCRWSSHIAVMLVITLLTAFLRVYALDRQILWGDEGISYGRANLLLGVMLGQLSVEQMPLYYALLHLWMRIAGRSVWALRMLSALADILLTLSSGPITVFPDVTADVP